MTKEETLKDIPGYEGLYKIGNNGTTISCAKAWKSGRWLVRKNPEMPLKQSLDKKGYPIVGLRKDGVGKMFKVHRLVALAFIPNTENKPQVNHKNGIKTDNRVENLEWCTPGENMKHAESLSLIDHPVGERHGRSKLTESDILEIRCSSLSSYKLGVKYNVAYSTIDGIKSRKYWKHIPNQPI